jgi:hypothetical protein
MAGDKWSWDADSGCAAQQPRTNGEERRELDRGRKKKRHEGQGGRRGSERRQFHWPGRPHSSQMRVILCVVHAPLPLSTLRALPARPCVAALSASAVWRCAKALFLGHPSPALSPPLLRYPPLSTPVALSSHSDDGAAPLQQRPRQATAAAVRPLALVVQLPPPMTLRLLQAQAAVAAAIPAVAVRRVPLPPQLPLPQRLRLLRALSSRPSLVHCKPR